jgi:hypothetical protein
MRTLGLLSVLFVLSACSSENKSEGSGGASSGGTSSGGTSSGGTSSGGSAGAGGSAGSTGGSAGAGGTATGGAAGSSTGGAAGAGGSGGSGVNPKCQPLCDAIIGAKCSGGPTMSGCLLTCKTLTSSPKCDPTADKYFACVQSKGVQCNAAGDPYAPGCGIDWLKAIDCATTESPNPAMVTPCSDYCKKVTAKACVNNGPEAECNSNCKWLGATGTGCDDEWGTYLTCANKANFVCLLGYAAPQGCGTEFTAYTKCVNAAGK